MASDWSWKVDDRAANSGLRLRYEPGAWGDLLKLLWVERLVPALLDQVEVLRYADLFAGAPDYPRVQAVDARVGQLAAAGIEIPSFLTAQGAVLPSTAGRVLSLAAGRIEAAVYDIDDGRRAAWGGRVEVLPIASGWQGFQPGLLGPRDLVLVDPYDLDKQGSQAAKGINALAASGAHVLLYLYNRSPKGAALLRDYERFVESLSGAVRIIGRLPADARLPRAWHELILIEGRASRCPIPAELLDDLATVTERAAGALLRHSSVERGP